MEVKLTADWIFTHNSEVIYRDGKCCFRILEGEFLYYLVELALKTLNVKYECEELFEDDDLNYEHPMYFYSFENLEDIKETCPILHSELQKEVNRHNKWKSEIERKQNLIIEFLCTAKSVTQIHKHLMQEELKYNGEGISKEHTLYLLDDLEFNQKIETHNKKYRLRQSV